MRHNGLWRSLVVIVAALGPLLAACDGEETPRPGSVPTAPAAEAEQVTIRFAVYSWQRAAYEDLIKIFEEGNPGLRIQFVSIEEIDAAGPMGWPDWALGWYAGLATVHGLRPLFVTDLAELQEPFSFSMEWEGLINQGRAAMWTIARSESTALLGPGGSHVGVARLPVVPGGAGGHLQARGCFISAQAEAPQVCWEWISFLTGQVEAVEALPARRSVAESEAYGQRVGEERAAAYRASVAGLERPFQVFTEGGWLREAMYWLFQAYGQVLEGEASVEETLRSAQWKADDYRACVMARDAFSDQEGWRACLKEVDPTLPDFLFEAGEGE